MSATDGGEAVRRKGGRALAIAVIAVPLALAAGIAGITFTGSARDGEPMASLTLAPSSDFGGAQPLPPAGHATRSVNGNLVSDLALLDDTQAGALPKIGPDGRTPMAAYAAGFNANEKRPRIAIVMMDLGVSDSASALALAKLPPAVTVALVPFSTKLQSLADQARGQGREVLLEVPMEPFDFPDSDPGPHALLTAAHADENAKRLNWALGRMTGYVGVANLQGGRFLGETGAVEPVLSALAARGLMFFDTGANSNSVAATAARHVGATNAAGAAILDTVQMPDAIDAQLAQLESDAKMNGSAVGTASPYPVSIDRIVQWAAGREARGFVLAPLTATATHPAPPAPKQ